MLKLHGRILFAVVGACLAITATASDDAGLVVYPNRSFVHKDSQTSLTVPDGWTIIPPYRLRRTTASSILSLEKQNPLITATVVWSPLIAERFSDIVRASDDEKNFGNEYEMLATIYGKDKVSRPVTMKVGPYTVYKITLDAGPEREGLNAGAVYMFPAGTKDNPWKVKIRADYPMLHRTEHMKMIEELVGKFKEYRD